MTRYRRSYLNQLIAIAIILALAIARWQGWLPETARDPSSHQGGGLPPGIYSVERVVDGDTILLVGGDRVRLQGINCPEIARDGRPADRLGPEATTFTQRFVRDSHHRIRIEVDGEPIDHHGRWLAFIWHDNRMLNEELIRTGLARAMLRYDYGQSKKDRFRAAQLEAQRAARGIWSED
jgi:micrococcal nuclease